MQTLGLKGKFKHRKYRTYQSEIGKIAENLLQQHFHASAPNQKCVTDVTGLKCTQGKLYLSPIKDLFNGEIIAYDVARQSNFEQITRMMKQAIARLDGATPILHSDQGWQYKMTSYRELCRQNGIMPSMSRKGNCSVLCSSCTKPKKIKQLISKESL